MSAQPQGAMPDMPRDPQFPVGPPLRLPAPGPPRPFLPGGPVAPRGPPPRPSGPNSFAPQQPPQQQQHLPPRPQQLPFNQQPGPNQQPPGNFNPQHQQIRGPPPQRQPPPQQLQQQSSLEKINANQQPPNIQQQRQPAPPLGQVSRQGSLAAIPDQLGQLRRPPMEPEGTPPAIIKNRSFSIAGPTPIPGVPLHDEERRRSISALGARPDEPVSRSPALAFIKEGVQSFDKKESPLNIGLTRLSKEDGRGSKESVKSDSSEKGGNVIDRPESRLSGSKMTDSIMGSLDVDERKNGSPKPQSPFPKKDDDDDVVINSQVKSNSPAQNGTPNKSPSPNPNLLENGKNSSPALDRSPSLSRSDSSPDQKPGLPPPKTESPFRPPSVLSNASKTPDPGAKSSPVPHDPRPASVLSNKSEKRMDTPEPKIPIPEKRAETPDSVNARPGSRAGVKPTDFASPIVHSENAVPRKCVSAPKTRREGDNDSGVDESTQGNDHVNGSNGSPGKKSPSKIPGLKGPAPASARAAARSPSKPHTPNTPDSTASNASFDKKIPMNKVQVGAAPSPNIKSVKSKIGSLDNATHKPGGGNIRIEHRRLDFKASPKIAAKNDTYVPGGGDKKITQKKLTWNAKSKIGSLENATHKPGGGDKKIETVKLDFKDKAKPKVASTVNITHKPGGGDVKIENQKVEIKAHSKVGSLDNVKHKPGGGDIKIFDDKEYLKQISATDAHATSEDSDYMSLQDGGYRRESLGPRSLMGPQRSSLRRPQRPRTAREPSAQRRQLSPRKCQTPRIEVGMERPPFRIY